MYETYSEISAKNISTMSIIEPIQIENNVKSIQIKEKIIEYGKSKSRNFLAFRGET